MELAYKGRVIEVKDCHVTGIHNNYVARVIQPGLGVVASFGKVVPPLVSWDTAREDATRRAKAWVDADVARLIAESGLDDELGA